MATSAHVFLPMTGLRMVNFKVILFFEFCEKFPELTYPDFYIYCVLSIVLQHCDKE